jgi:hypothetical protein
MDNNSSNELRKTNPFIQKEAEGEKRKSLKKLN